jgi:hypothetical protein
MQSWGNMLRFDNFRFFSEGQTGQKLMRQLRGLSFAGTAQNRYAKYYA